MAKKTTRAPRKKRVPKAAEQAEPRPLDRVQALVQDEIVHQGAIEKSRQPLALIAEASIRRADETLGPGYVIVDAGGAARTTLIDGVATPFTIADLVAELRAAHPNLFGGVPQGNRPDASAEPLGPPASSSSSARVGAGATDAGERTVQGEFELSLQMPPVASAVEAAPSPFLAERAAAAAEPAPSAATEPARRDWIMLDPAATRPEPAARAEHTPLAEPAPPAEPVAPEAEAAPRVPAKPVAPAEIAALPRPHPNPTAAIAASPAPRPLPPRAFEAVRRRSALLPPAWMPSRSVRLRALYVAAFVSGLVVYGTIRHLT